MWWGIYSIERNMYIINQNIVARCLKNINESELLGIVSYPSLIQFPVYVDTWE